MSRFRNFARLASADLDGEIGWLLDRGIPAAVAERVLTAVLVAAERIAQLPLLGRRRPE